jgi:hypothetical protein
MEPKTGLSLVGTSGPLGVNGNHLVVALCHIGFFFFTT